MAVGSLQRLLSLAHGAHDGGIAEVIGEIVQEDDRRAVPFGDLLERGDR